MTGILEQIRNEGLEQGMSQSRAEIAENMLKDGILPFDKISLYSGLSVAEIQELASALGKN